MRVVLQRVSRASVRVGDRTVGSIERGLLLLVGFNATDGDPEIEWMARKVVGLRVFNDHDQKMNLSVEEVGGDLLVVSQFTLYGDAKKGRRPSFVGAADPALADPLYQRFTARLRELFKGSVEEGEFGAMMEIDLVNDGPVTLVIDRDRE
jgi:D-tyrosyl-tRNA(Tyr) deacylase